MTAKILIVEDQEANRTAGFRDYLTKPTHIPELLEAIRRILEEKKGASDGKNGQTHSVAQGITESKETENVLEKNHSRRVGLSCRAYPTGRKQPKRSLH